MNYSYSFPFVDLYHRGDVMAIFKKINEVEQWIHTQGWEHWGRNGNTFYLYR